MYRVERPSLESSLDFRRVRETILRAFYGRQNFLVFFQKSQKVRINPAQSAPEDTPLGVRGVERTSGGLTLDGKALKYLTSLRA